MVVEFHKAPNLKVLAQFAAKREPFLVKHCLEKKWLSWTVPELLRRCRRNGKGDLGSWKDFALLPKKKGDNFVSQWKAKSVKVELRKALEDLGNGVKFQMRLDPALFWVDEELPGFCLDSRFQAKFDNSFLWLTGKGLRTSLHSDEDDGILLHLSGRKRALLISPKVSDCDSKITKSLMKYRWKNGTLQEVYYNKNDKFISEIEKEIVDLEPGDILYLPKRYLHDIESETTTVSVATRFRIG